MARSLSWGELWPKISSQWIFNTEKSLFSCSSPLVPNPVSPDTIDHFDECNHIQKFKWQINGSQTLYYIAQCLACAHIFKFWSNFPSLLVLIKYTILTCPSSDNVQIDTTGVGCRNLSAIVGMMTQWLIWQPYLQPYLLRSAKDSSFEMFPPTYILPVCLSS